MTDAAWDRDSRAGDDSWLTEFSKLVFSIRRGTAKALLSIALFPAEFAVTRGPTSSASILAFSRLAQSLARLYAVWQRQIREERLRNQWQQKARDELGLHRDIVRRLVSSAPHRFS